MGLCSNRVMARVIIQCCWCGKDVEKDNRAVNKAHKSKKHMFCNVSCGNKYRYKSQRDNFVIPLEKTCICCNQTKLLGQFHPAKNRLDGRASYCKVCQAEYASRYAKKQKYGLTPEHEAETLEEQEGVCAVCGCDPPLCVDHCHNTKVIRGLICNKCNLGIGFLGDDLEGLLKAVAYLERNLSADNI